jgi:hypothetical protein
VFRLRAATVVAAALESIHTQVIKALGSAESFHYLNLYGLKLAATTVAALSNDATHRF